VYSLRGLVARTDRRGAVRLRASLSAGLSFDPRQVAQPWGEIRF
jgi:hypothetical protein